MLRDDLLARPSARARGREKGEIARGEVWAVVCVEHEDARRGGGVCVCAGEARLGGVQERVVLPASSERRTGGGMMSNEVLTWEWLNIRSLMRTRSKPRAAFGLRASTERPQIYPYTNT